MVEIIKQNYRAALSIVDDVENILKALDWEDAKSDDTISNALSAINNLLYQANNKVQSEYYVDNGLSTLINKLVKKHSLNKQVYIDGVDRIEKYIYYIGLN